MYVCHATVCIIYSYIVNELPKFRVLRIGGNEVHKAPLNYDVKCNALLRISRIASIQLLRQKFDEMLCRIFDKRSKLVRHGFLNEEMF